jgi:hypothetical protein
LAGHAGDGRRPVEEEYGEGSADSRGVQGVMSSKGDEWVTTGVEMQPERYVLTVKEYRCCDFINAVRIQ